jgi:hypothetical protein
VRYMSKFIKKHRVMLIILGIAIVILGSGFYRSNKNSYKKLIGVSLPKGSTVIIEEDSHGGFLGDGEYYSEIQLTDDGVEKFLNNVDKTGKWLPLPLSEDIETLLYHTGDKSKNIPKDVNNGIYYIRDRFAEKYPDMKDQNILSRPAFNVIVSILDLDTKKLYIYKLDT